MPFYSADITVKTEKKKKIKLQQENPYNFNATETLLKVYVNNYAAVYLHTPIGTYMPEIWKPLFESTASDGFT